MRDTPSSQRKTQHFPDPVLWRPVPAEGLQYIPQDWTEALLTALILLVAQALGIFQKVPRILRKVLLLGSVLFFCVSSGDLFSSDDSDGNDAEG